MLANVLARSVSYTLIWWWMTTKAPTPTYAYSGLGTTARAAYRLGRRFVMVERSSEYMAGMKADLCSWMGADSSDVQAIGTDSLDGWEYEGFFGGGV